MTGVVSPRGSVSFRSPERYTAECNLAAARATDRQSRRPRAPTPKADAERPALNQIRSRLLQRRRRLGDMGLHVFGVLSASVA